MAGEPVKDYTDIIKLANSPSGNSGGGFTPYSDKQLAIGAGGEALSGLVGSLFGVGQLLSGNNMMDNLKVPQVNFDRYQVPEQFRNNVNSTMMNYYNMLMPGQTTAENKISGTTSGSVRAATNTGTSASDILSTIAGLDANEKAARNNLATTAGQFHLQNFDRLLGANKDLGSQEGFAQQYNNQLKEKEFEYNEMNPYLREYQRGLQMQGAGTQNIFGGITKGIGAGADLAMLLAL